MIKFNEIKTENIHLVECVTDNYTQEVALAHKAEAQRLGCDWKLIHPRKGVFGWCAKSELAEAHEEFSVKQFAHNLGFED